MQKKFTMSEIGTGSNFYDPNANASSLPRTKSKIGLGNRTNIEWKYGVDVLDNGRKVKCNYHSKTFNGEIFKFKHLLVVRPEEA